MPHTKLRGLKDLAHDPRLMGVWTWSRGGGWGGPRIQNELWCDLNAYVVASFAREPWRSEADHFQQYARTQLGLNHEDAQRLRQASLLSEQAVLRGQMSALGASVYEWWARDDTLSEPDLGDFVSKGLVHETIAEKQAAVALWQRIAALLQVIQFADAPTGEFACVSARYGLYKYQVIAAGWTALLLTEHGKASGQHDGPGIAAAVAAYDHAWVEWRQLAADHPLCPSLPQTAARGGGPGLQAAIERCRPRRR
jgi:hypothetical protein